MKHPITSISVLREYKHDDCLVGRLWGKRANGDNVRWKTRGEEGETISRTYIYTLELPWRDNARGKSCVPDAEIFTLIKRRGGGFFNRYKKRFGHEWVPQITGVEPERSDILIHVGNTAKDTEGCVLLGLSRNTHDPESGNVGQSALAYKMFYETLEAENPDVFPISINFVDGYGPCRAC